MGLTWPDLDTENGRVAIRRALLPIDGKLVETEPKTKRGRRLIALDAETVAVLREQAARQLGCEQEAQARQATISTLFGTSKQQAGGRSVSKAKDSGEGPAENA